MGSIETAATTYGNYFTQLTPATVDQLRGLATADLVFRDPFNEVRGVDRVIGLLRHMFQSVDRPIFVIGDQATGTNLAFLTWTFTCHVKHFGRLEISGASELRFDNNNLVKSHVDHWDAAAQVYQRVPLLGGCLKFLRRRIAYSG